MQGSTVVKVDDRGRIVIPHGMRKTMGMAEKCYVIVRPLVNENKIELIPLAISEESEIFRVRVRLPDKVGLIAQISGLFARYKSSIIFNQTIVLNKGYEAEWTAVATLPTMSLDQFKEILIKEGKAKKVIFEDKIEDRES